MLVIGELGFPVALVIIFFVFLPIALILRHKWWIEVEKREEIGQLIDFAAEEADRPDFEVSFGFDYRVAQPYIPPASVFAPPGRRVCVVCFTPTSNRCARCKSVNYCSGKCQIIHWREGHKDECHPLPANSEIKDKARKFVGNALKQPFSDDHVTQIKNDPLSSDKQSETVSEGRKSSNPAFSSPYVSLKEENTEIGSSYLSIEEPDSISAHHDKSIFFEAPASYPAHDTCADILSSESCDSSSTFDKNDHQMEQIKPLKENSFTRVDFDGGSSASEGQEDDTMIEERCSLRVRVSHSVKNVNPSISTPSFWDGTLDTRRTRKYVPNIDTKPKPVGPGNEKLPAFKSTVHSSPELPSLHASDTHPLASDLVGSNPGLAGTAKVSVKTNSAIKEYVPTMLSQSPIFSNSKRPGTRVNSGVVSDDTLKDVSLPSGTSIANDLKKKNRDRQQLPTSHKIGFSLKQPDEVSSSGLKGNSALAAKSVKASGYSAMPPQVARSMPSTSVGLKSSMLKVVEQLKDPKSSKHADVAVRNGQKAVIAYDAFVKLYHWKNNREFRPFGLINCGNSCYANAVLQCLIFTPPLTGYLFQGLHSKACMTKEWCFTCELERLVLKAKEVGYPQSPIGILSHLQHIGNHLTNGREEDAHEFLRYAIETLQSTCLREAGIQDFGSLEEETTILGLTFGGYLRSKIKCSRCRVNSEMRERMMDITVEIDGDVETLEDALRQFTRTENLDGENKYHCGRCNSYEKANKKLNILEAPNILTVVLKRFQSGRYGKLNKSIRFPEILNLVPYMTGGSDKSPVYELYGVVVHLDTMNASFTGHYVCYVRAAQNKWFKIDDSTVKPVGLDTVLKEGAYMLFYSRCSPRAPRSIRNTIVSRDLISKLKLPPADPSLARSSTSTQRYTPDDLSNLGYVHQERTSSPLLPSNIEVDSSSDNSSLFSNSDVLSTSTDNTRESNSADDIPEGFFGYNTFRRPSDSDTSSSSSSSPEYMKRSLLSYSERYASSLPGESASIGGGAFLHSNSNGCEVTNLVNISASETDPKRLGRANPLDNTKSGVHLRRSSRKEAD